MSSALSMSECLLFGLTLPVKKEPLATNFAGVLLPVRSEAVPNDGLFGGQTGGRPGGLGRFPDGDEHHGDIT